MKPKKGEVVALKDKLWLKRQKYAGRVVAKVHQELYAMIRGRSAHLSLSKMGDVAEDIIRKNDCTPTFLNYRGFPSVICTSLNKELVHGFATRDTELQEGDVLKVDIGATFEGAIGDCAVTYVYGKAKNDKVLKMLVSCQDALYDAIKAFKPGRRMGEVSTAIWRRGKKDGFGVITAFGGHGLDYDKLHAAPFVPNISKINEGIVIQPGMSIAIEPMFVLGKNTNTRILNDKWTVVTRDVGCHYEHSVTLDEDGHQHIMTDHGICAKDFV
jgi:methionyl aminopeptidase